MGRDIWAARRANIPRAYVADTFQGPRQQLFGI